MVPDRRKHRQLDVAATAFLQSVGAAIKQWRQSTARLTKDALAYHLRVARRTVDRWEDGSGDPRMSVIFDMERLAPGLLATLADRGVWASPDLSTESGKPVNTSGS